MSKKPSAPWARIRWAADRSRYTILCTAPTKAELPPAVVEELAEIAFLALPSEPMRYSKHYDPDF